ncbi:MAG: DUF5916 domain-containing protein [Hyalangium sp.]|uniref:DUF5916 domain-containing protein n=1 Tax=Hyalangium sp. TaxID=2028555 RepID=UPI00389AA094
MTALLMASAPVFAAIEGPGINQFLQAERTPAPVQLDGLLDEPGWQAAPLFDSFVQLFPDEGAAPTERTELRFLYDDQNLYVGVICHDSQPELIARPLGRRDKPPPNSDFVLVGIDSAHDHLTAFAFQVTAGGVLLDTLFYADNKYTDEWDAVWDAAVAERADGWSLEMLIPLSVLRFPAAPVQTWGISVQRHISRKHEDVLTVFIPREAQGVVSRFGHLTGLKALQPRRNAELTAYAAARVVSRPRFSDAARPWPRLWNPSGDVGVDLKAGINSGLQLNATLNPDFGQVEADEIIANLTNAEPFFPEKRPFFTQGMDLFQPVGAQNGRSPQMLFYSRRIGLGTPILGAAKLTGQVVDGVDVGLLNALVTGASSPAANEDSPDRRLSFHLPRPLHVGLDRELPALAPAAENYFVAAARKRVSGMSTVGARFTSALPLSGPCTDEEAVLGDGARPTRCDARGGNAGAVEWDFGSADRVWAFLGQLSASQVLGGPPERTLRDGTVLRRGDIGAGGYLYAGKPGGEPFRFDFSYEYSMPRLDLNAAGFQQDQNLQGARLSLKYVRPNGVGPWHSFTTGLNLNASLSTDGRWTQRGRGASYFAEGLLRSFDSVGLSLGVDDPQFDLRELDGAGVPFQRTHAWNLTAYGGTDPKRAVAVSGSLSLRRHSALSGARLGYGGALDFTLRPQARLETLLALSLDFTPHGPRWVEDSGTRSPIFGDLDAYVLSLTLRQLLVLTPKLTLQAYAQFFSAFGRYGPFWAPPAMEEAGAPIRLSALIPTSYEAGDPSFRTSALNLNVVLRWEYSLGSALFLVYTREQTELPTLNGERARMTLLPQRLLQGRATDGLLVKWSYWWG